MPRSRLGAVLLLPEPAATEVDALRRALADRSLGWIPPHLTLVPPVNVREDDVSRALEVLREAAARCPGPLTLRLGPPGTFLPDNPVLHLEVDGDLDGLARLRAGVFVPPLERALSWPWVPHVTLADESTPERIAAALIALADFEAPVTFDRVHLMRQEADRVWRPYADAALGPPAVVGRGSPLALEVTESAEAPPDARALADAEWRHHDEQRFGPGARWEKVPFALTARREGAVAGVATGWTGGGVGYLGELVVATALRGQGVGSHLLAAFEDLAARRGCGRLALRTDAGSDAQAFYEARGWRVEARLDRWLHDTDFVQMRRDR